MQNENEQMIQRDLELRIIQGKIIDKLPHVVIVADEFHVRTSEASRVFRKMKDEGIITGDPAAGNYSVCAGAKEKLISKYETYLEKELKKCESLAKEMGINLAEYMQNRTK